MSFFKNGLVLCVFMMMICVGVTRGGIVYKVGESSGWSNVGKLDYMGWARNITFHVGDKIVFEYNKRFHNVVRVTHKAFNNCNATAPITTYNSGNDTFNIRLVGHYYFICGIPGHCEAGQKVDIRVPKSISPTSAPANSPSSPKNIAPDNSPSMPEISKVPSPSPTSVSLAVPAPAPAKSNASIFGINNKVLLSVFVLVCFV